MIRAVTFVLHLVFGVMALGGAVVALLGLFVEYNIGMTLAGGIVGVLGLMGLNVTKR